MATSTQVSRLGVLVPDRTRSILVIAPLGEMAVALRERVSRTLAVVRDVRPQEMSDGVRACVPWPWMVVGQVESISEPVRATLSAEPVLIYWRGPVPEGLPAHVREFGSFSLLAEAVGQALGARVAGLQLAAGVGVELPDGQVSGSLPLQALVSGHPHAFHLPRRKFASSTRVLARSAARLRLVGAAGGGVRLVPVDRTAGSAS